MLPRKIEKPPRFNMAKRVRSPSHMDWVRSHHCVACGGSENMHAHHVRLGSHAGMGQRPGDDVTVSLCANCHRHLHNDGEDTFQRTWEVDLLALAAEFAAKSPKLKGKR
jgi:hypothetical protein